MKTKLFLMAVLTGVLALLFLPVLLFAQTNGVPLTAEDEAIRTALGKYSVVKIFMVPLVGVIVMAVRKWIGRIPDQAWPWVTPFIGVGLDYLASKMGFWTGSVEAGAAMGGLAVWFSQLGKQTKEVLKEGATVTTSGMSNTQEAVPTKPEP